MDVQSNSASSAVLAEPQQNTPLPLVLVDDTGNAIDIEIRQDGYVNATKLCQAMGKEWRHYFQPTKTKEFLAALSEAEKITVERPATIVAGQISTGLIQTGISRTQHTWVHPDVAINLAQWASAKYGVAVSRLVRRYQTGKVTTAESLAASRTLAAQISFVDGSADLEKHRIDAHAKLELEKYKYQADVDAKLAIETHNLTCDAGNTKYFRSLEHEKELLELKSQAEMRVLDRERVLCERYGYPFAHLTVANWWNEYVTLQEHCSISLNDALGHYRKTTGHETPTKKFQSELAAIGVRVTMVYKQGKTVSGFRDVRFKSLSDRDTLPATGSEGAISPTTGSLVINRGKIDTFSIHTRPHTRPSSSSRSLASM